MPASALHHGHPGQLRHGARRNRRPAAAALARKAKTRVSIEVLPQIAQQGKRAANPDAAKAAGHRCTVKPARRPPR